MLINTTRNSILHHVNKINIHSYSTSHDYLIPLINKYI